MTCRYMVSWRSFCHGSALHQSFHDASYVNYSTLGLSLQYAAGSLDCVHVYNDDCDGFQK